VSGALVQLLVESQLGPEHEPAVVPSVRRICLVATRRQKIVKQLSVVWEHRKMKVFVASETLVGLDKETVTEILSVLPIWLVASTTAKTSVRKLIQRQIVALLHD